MSTPVAVAPAFDQHVTGTSHRQWTWFFVSFGVLSVGVLALLLSQVEDLGRSNAWVLALAVAAWAGLRVSVVIAGGTARFFAFFFWLFTYIFMGIAPAVQIRSDQVSTTTPGVVPSLDSLTMWTVILGVVCFEAGTLCSRLTRPSLDTASSLPRPSPYAATLRPAATVLLAMGGLAIAAYYLSKVGLDAQLTSREAASGARARVWPDISVRAIVYTSAIYAPLVSMGALIMLRRAERRWPIHALYTLLILIELGALAIVVNPVSSARFTLGTVLFALLILVGGAATPRRVRMTLTAAVLGLFFLFPLADAFRTSERNFTRAGFFEEYAGNPDYDSIWQLANALTYWFSGVAEPGRQALGIPFFWVPRGLWPDKPVDTGVLLANYNGYGLTNLSAPLWAEAVINGGLIAVAVVFTLLGFLVHRFDSRLITALKTGGVWLIVGAALPAYFMILLRGSLLQATGAVAVIAVCLFVVHRPPRQRSAAA